MTKPGRLELDVKELNALLDRIEQHKLTETDYPLIADLIRSMAWLSQSLEDQNVTIHRLRKIFGFKTERTSYLPDATPGKNPPERKPDNNNKDERTAGNGDTEETPDASRDNNIDWNSVGEGDKSAGNKRTRQGRKFSAKDYKDAVVSKFSHALLRHGCRCPDCQSGNLRTVDPGVVLRILGQPWLQAYIYELERLRCNTCGKRLLRSYRKLLQGHRNTTMQPKRLLAFSSIVEGFHSLDKKAYKQC